MNTFLVLVHTGTVIEEGNLTLAELCQACGAHADWIINLVEESILEPHGENIYLWRFSGASLVRARSAFRLQHGLGLNLAGVAVVLNLMAELENLRSQIKAQGQD